MTEVIAFRDVEAVTVGYLGDGRLTGRMGATVHVDTRMLNPRPALAVKVTRVGGVRHGIVLDRPMVWVECWAQDDTVAATLAMWARAELEALDDSDPRYPGIAYRGEVAGLAYNEDPTSETPRYTFTVELIVRGYAAQP